MKTEVTITFCLPYDIDVGLFPYLERTGAASRGDFILQAINHNRRCEGREKIDITSCENRNNLIIKIDRRKRRHTMRKITLVFSGQSGEIMAPFFKDITERQMCSWIEGQINEYVRFLDMRPDMNVGKRPRVPAPG